MSNFLSFFNRQVPEPNFTNFSRLGPAHATQIVVTLDTTTHVDPPLQKRIPHVPTKLKRISRAAPLSRISAKQQPDPFSDPQADRTESVLSPRASRALTGRQQPAFPDTPSAPQANRTTFMLPPRREPLAPARWYTDNDNDLGNNELPPESTEYQYMSPEPKTLSRKLFLFGFLCPVLWLAGVMFMLITPRTSRNGEMGNTPSGVAWEMSILRAAELRWARRCLTALITETIVISLIIVTVKLGLKAPA